MAYKLQTFLTVLEAGKSKVMVLADLVSGEGHFLVDSPLPTVTSHGRKRRKKLSGVFFCIRALIPVTRTQPS